MYLLAFHCLIYLYLSAGFVCHEFNFNFWIDLHVFPVLVLINIFLLDLCVMNSIFIIGKW
jgi:hypothetical protein